MSRAHLNFLLDVSAPDPTVVGVAIHSEEGPSVTTHFFTHRWFTITSMSGSSYHEAKNMLLNGIKLDPTLNWVYKYLPEHFPEVK